MGSMRRCLGASAKVLGGAGFGGEAHLSRARGREPGVWSKHSPLPPQASPLLEAEWPRRVRQRAELPQDKSRYPPPPPADPSPPPLDPPPPPADPSPPRGATRTGNSGLPGKTWLLVPAWFLLFSGLAIYYFLGHPSAASWKYLPSPATSRPVSVLMWWDPFHGSAKIRRPAPDCLRLFNLSGCRLLTDRRDYWEAQAVLFHHRDLVGNKDWPPPASEPRVGPQPTEAGVRATTRSAGRLARPPGQRWVWMNFESPSNSPRLESLDSSLFNWTLSYRADSDIFVPYGYLYPRTSPQDQPSGTIPPLGQKQGLVAWVVSNWNERQARVRYYRELSRHLRVDVYGRRGPDRRPVPDAGLLPTVARYKFYLAFENSQHPDYITEKLWRNSLLAGAVPVVLGPSRDNYERFVPRNAFIHVDDFPSAAALAAYLRFLDRNQNEYRRYFEWRRRYAVHFYSFWAEPWCRTCQALQNAGDQPKKISNLAAWFRKRDFR
ncbi:alpha-(1,3)-fucosyltransferase 4 [Macrotis lagotis]|uniref:alpha-(1,3)-fucosyltransferase 4 n=1 Tax=Macrotis lagotis TaxID=92651 RepID=UPI003D680AD5